MNKYLHIGLFSLILLLSAGCINQPSTPKYEANWESLKAHTPAPEWLKDAKLGIYFHWGVYCVPAYDTEWYPYAMHRPGNKIYKHHLEKYGHPSEFGYHDFIKDFTAEKFDPEEWAELFEATGARFAGPVAEHHDGFAMWDSKITPWNAANMGPKKDVLGELFKALRKRDLKTIATFHHSRNLQRYEAAPEPDDMKDLPVETQSYRGNPRWNSHFANFEGMPTASNDPKLQLLYGNMPEDKWVEEVWLGKLYEVINTYQPDIIWFDSWLNWIPEKARQEFCATYLNAAEKQGKEVVIIRKKLGLPKSFTVVDHEKSREPKALPKVWMTDDTISKGSWCYTENMDVKSADMIIHSLIDTVAKNGIMLLNVSPRADGVIPQNQRAVMKEIGNWLQINGESIYSTRPWIISAEGPTAEPTGGFADAEKFLKLSYTDSDYRYTRSKDQKTVYASILGWPGAGTTKLFTAFATTTEMPPIKSVRMLGCDETIQWEHTAEGLNITMPSTTPSNDAVVFAIER